MRKLGSDELVRGFSERAFDAGGTLTSEDEYTDRLLGIYRRALSRRHAIEPQPEEAIS